MFLNTVLKDYWFRASKQTGQSEISINKTINNHANYKKNLVEGVDRSHRYLGPGDIAILPEIFYTGEYTFFGHRPRGSWHGDDVAVVIWI
jgi:hypothetical protein